MQVRAFGIVLAAACCASVAAATIAAAAAAAASAALRCLCGLLPLLPAHVTA